MTILELIQLREDALSVIIEIYRMPQEERLASHVRSWALERAVAMFNAADAVLPTTGYSYEDAERWKSANLAYDRLISLEERAKLVVELWRDKRHLNTFTIAMIDSAVGALAELYPSEGGDS